jgi:hypothetical protein
VRYRSHASRERALAVQDENPIVHHGVRVRLEQEETAQRTLPAVPEFCALLRASPFPTEHFSPVEIAAAFSKCGEVIEIDPICLQGHDMSAVKVVVQLYSEAAIAAIPGDLWPCRGPWGTRISPVQVVQVWCYEQSFEDGVYCHFFGPPPPPPFRPSLPPLPGRQPNLRDNATSQHSSEGRVSDVTHGPVVRGARKNL